MLEILYYQNLLYILNIILTEPIYNYHNNLLVN